MTELVHKPNPSLFLSYLRSYRTVLGLCVLVLSVCCLIILFRWQAIYTWYVGHRVSAPVLSFGCILLSVVTVTLPFQIWLLYKALNSFLGRKMKEKSAQTFVCCTCGLVCDDELDGQITGESFECNRCYTKESSEFQAVK